MKIRLLLVISNISKVIFFEWLADSLNKDLLDVTFVVMNDGPTEIEKILVDKGHRCYHIPYSNKIGLPRAIVRLMKILDDEKIDVIHTHLLDATLAGMIAGKLRNIRKRIFTRHHSNYHRVYNKKGILYDKLCNFLSTDIVAITDIVKAHLLLEGAKPDKISLIHHGFRLEEYANCSVDRVRAFKNKYNLTDTHTIVGVVSRYTKWKGIQFIIPAFAEFAKTDPNAVLVLANAKGNDELMIRKLLGELPKESVREIVYEQDMSALYNSLDIFVHVPIDRESEAFGQVYIEAMAARVPSILTLSGIANDFVVDETHALIVPFCNSEKIYEGLIRINGEHEFALQLAVNAQLAVMDKFSLSKMVEELENLYLNK